MCKEVTQVRKINRNMCEGPMLGNIILYTIPIILTSVLQLLFNAADLVVVGRFCGSVSVAAVGATSSLTHFIVNLFIGISVGSGVAVAQSIGAGDNEKTHRVVHTAMPLALISGVILTVIGIILSKPLLELMDTPESVIDLATVYMQIFFCGMIFNMLYNFGAAILRAAGDTKGPLVYLTISGVLNVILNVIFVTVFDMNVAGVALATTISQALSAVLVIFSLMSRHDQIYFSLKEMRIDMESTKNILKVGIPSGIQSSIFSIANVLIQSSINSFGATFVSGSAAAANIETFVWSIMNSFHQSALIFTGQNYGAKKPHRIKKIFLICLAGVTITGLVLGSLTFTFGKQLLSIYITDSQEAINAGLIRFTFVCLPYFLCGILDTTTGSIRGMGASVPPMIISIIGGCAFRVVWIYTIFSIPKYHTPHVLFAVYPISWTLTIIALLITFVIVYKKNKHKFESQNNDIQPKASTT